MPYERWLAVLDDDLAVADHPFDFGDIGQSLVGLAIDDENIGELAGFERPELVNHVEQLGVGLRGYDEHVGRGRTRPPRNS